MKLEQVETIADLKMYLYNHPSPVVADTIHQAIQFFATECKKENGYLDWKAIKKRQKMGLGFQLKDETEIDADVAYALNAWITYHGRNLGTTFLDAMLSGVIGGMSNSREEVSRILRFFMEKEEKE